MKKLFGSLGLLACCSGLTQTPQPSEDADMFWGIFDQNFAIPSTENEVPLVICGGDVRVEFAEVESEAVLVCSGFSGVDITPAEPKPADCDLDWQGEFVLLKNGEAKIRWSCQSDTIFGSPNVSFADGEVLSGNGWFCERQGEGLTCASNNNHGFTINRSEQKIF